MTPRSRAIGFVALLAVVFMPLSMAIEIPKYRVLEQEGAYELREYSPYLLAETEVEAGFMNAGNIAFGRLFRYISGANSAQTEIAMTAPVEQSRGEGVYRVGFVVPSKYTRDTVPKPLDPRVSIREVGARKVAVWRYSGRWTEENFREYEQQLRQILLRKKLQAESGDSAIIARYDAPFIPWFMRRNEVLIPLQTAPTLH